MDTRSWLRAAGFVTWVASGVPAALAISAGQVTGISAVAWIVAFAAFGIAFSLVCFWEPRTSWIERVLVLVQSLAGAVMVLISRDGLAGATFVVVAAQIIELMPARIATVWVGAQTADRERLAREELARAHAELQATQALLSENIRVAERLRISRDLHDTLGHHLTALSLQLEVASRLSSGAVMDRVNEAHAITKLLLSDVRDVVSRLRESSAFDLGAAIHTLARATVQPQVHVEVAEGLVVDDPLQAHAILRCVQEVITNAMRHAQARNLWITIDERPDVIVLTARDDGRGVDAVTWGNGLRGMRERFEELSGRVDFSSRPGAGFEVQAFVPK
ncbi:MAG: sensor histidine kinase [Acidobacteria bacterium]|nr:MAG: sensor histidine kinase [Acidobacteriota bacterium]